MHSRPSTGLPAGPPQGDDSIASTTSRSTATSQRQYALPSAPRPSRVESATVASSSAARPAAPLLGTTFIDPKAPTPHTVTYPEKAASQVRVRPLVDAGYSKQSPIKRPPMDPHLDPFATPQTTPAPRGTLPLQSAGRDREKEKDTEMFEGPKCFDEPERAAAPPRTMFEAASSRPAEGPTKQRVSSVDEAELARDVVFVWMGAESAKHCHYEKEKREYVVEATASARQKKMFASLQECGALCRQIKDLISSPSLSFLQQSLKHAIRKQMSQYELSVSDMLERGVVLTLPLLTLMHMKALPKLTMLHKILVDTNEAKGGELVTKLQTLNQQGSVQLAELLSEVYVEAVTPLLHMTTQWITRGEAPDPYIEFFIQPGDIHDDEDTFWTKFCRARPEMLPSVISEKTSNDVLLVGKNINFIRRCCGVKDWRMDAPIAAAAQHCTFDSLPMVVGSALGCTNAAVMKIINEKFRLNESFAMLRSIFLLANGAFFDAFIKRLEGVLQHPSNSVQMSTVQEQLHSTMHDMLAYFHGFDTDRLSLLDVQIEKDENVVGWDAFSFSYGFITPLNNIFDRPTMLAYKKLFRQMWKAKHAEVALKNAWSRHVALDQILQKKKQAAQANNTLLAYRQVAADAHLLGLELSHFVTNLYSYYVHEVNITAWESFQAHLGECRSIDDLRACHAEYLNSLALHSLLNDDCQQTRNIIDAILTLTRTFCVSQQGLSNLIEHNQGDPFRIKSVYQNIGDEFRREMTSLLSTLEEQHLKYDFMNFLALRLNFNHFYHHQTNEVQTDF